MECKLTLNIDIMNKIPKTRICYVIFYFLFIYSYAAYSQDQKKVTEPHPDSRFAEAVLLNRPLEGFRGIWYANQPSNDEYVYKYSGGLATYTANHNPLAIFAPEVNRTFFCYGGVNDQGDLIHSISYFDHNSRKVSRPVGVLDKRTTDAHDNPVMSIDGDGYIWIFSTSHGVSRPSYIHKSINPYDISNFQKIIPTKTVNGQKVPLDNFSYLQVYHDRENGFIGLFTYYDKKQLKFGEKSARVTAWMTSKNGQEWSEWNDLASIEEGHYQTSHFGNGKVGSSFNYHPNVQTGSGLNYRTNLYYVETDDFGKTWRNVNGTELHPPLTDINNDALVAEYASKNLNVYINDLIFDGDGNPVILYVVSKGYEAGPEKGPREWFVAFRESNQWIVSKVTSSDNNYDMGSIYIDSEKVWRILGPTEPGPQLYNTGGEVALWESRDKGHTWNLKKQLTSESLHNHSYVRRPLNVHPDFYALWADGHGRQPSTSRLYFSDSKGNVYQLPSKMKKDLVKLRPYNKSKSD